ncbi:MAG: HAMP domain-containing protein, partial [Chloroflexota bacterium]|nr:HAMP domain-containing protein [Chloroflexota bacterium]
MSFLGNLFAPSLLRALVGRTVGVAVAALVLLATVALYESNTLVSRQFEDEASIVASTAQKQIADQKDLMTRAASLIAGLPTTRELTEDHNVEGLRAFLIPQKSRLVVDIMNVASLDGAYISGAQDFEPGATLKPELVSYAKAGAQTSWVLYDEAEGLVIRAIYQIRGRDQEPVGVVEVGSVLDPAYLRSINTKSDAQILLVWNGQVRASTFVDAAGKALIIDGSVFPSVDAVDNAAGDTLSQNVTIAGQDYYGIYHVVRATGRQNPGVLAVLVPTNALQTAQRNLVALMAVLALGLMALVTFFAYRSASAMTTPLGDLADAAQRIEAGDLGVTVRQRSSHEIGTLERAFDTMARSLQDREHAQQEYLAEVRTVNEVADAVVGVTDRERIFAESLSRMVALFKADGASIVIREDPPGAPSGSGGRLVPATVMNVDPDTAVAIATRVLVSSAHDPNRIQHAQVPNVPLPYVAHIPLSARGRAVGLLSAYFKEPRDISETEARALRTIARLVSVAKENADLVS